MTQISQVQTANNGQNQNSNVSVLTESRALPATHEDSALYSLTFDNSLATKVGFGSSIKRRVLGPEHLLVDT